MEHKKYISIGRLKPEYADCFEVGDEICIQEKIDGANASFQYDAETDSIVAFSRNQILDRSNSLRGFFGFTQTLDKDLIKDVLGFNLRMFCEWLVPHTVVYPKEKYTKAYCYDVFDMEKQNFLPQIEVESLTEKLGLDYVPVFFQGQFVSWEQYLAFVGKTEMGGEYGEGVVVKNTTRLNHPDEKQPFYVKIVGETFQESKGAAGRILSAETLKSREESRVLCQSIVTEARVSKILHKMVDEELIPESWGREHMGIIAKNITKRTYEDCLKEEAEIVHQVEDFGKVTNGICMAMVKKFLSEKEKVC